MRITFLLPNAGLAGGVRVVAIYAKKLTERGHRVTVISQPPRQISLFQKIKLILMGKDWAKPPAKTPLLDFLGKDHVILNKPRPVQNNDVLDGDAVIATWWETAEWVAALDSSKGKKVYLLQGYEVFPHLPVQRVIDTYRLPLNRIAVSNYIGDVLKNKHKVKDTCIIHNSVDLVQFNSPPRIMSKTFTVGFMYSSAAIKKIELALSVIDQAKQRNDNLRVIAFGTRRPKGNHNIPEWVEYHIQPEQAAIPKIYAQCDVWLFTSEAEGFGLPILEAMACRTPVISTRAGAAPDLIDDQNGCLVETNAEAFLDKIEMFRDMDPDTWLSYSQHAYETARSYSWDDATDLLESELSKKCV
jgi:glycosyltransferase involved in cell wall biosynthesis